MTLGLRLRHLTFHGPSKKPATIEFGAGLNVVWGASDTGKSFITDAIDFMLGGKGPLRHNHEGEGYAQALLAVETLKGEQFTIQRSVDGSAFRVYDGLYSITLPQTEGTVLSEQHNDKKEDNLSAYLLAKLNLRQMYIRRNKRNDVQSLSFRNLARLAIVNEEEIIQKRSPLSDGNYTADTANTSTFKLLITGVDDSAIAAAKRDDPDEQSKSAKLEVLDELIREYRGKVRELAGQPKELNEQLDKLENAMVSQTETLQESESAFREVSKRRRGVQRDIEDAINRLTEITALLERFTLLEAHYASDTDRLAAIAEAGNLFGALGATSCPLCGADPDHQSAEDCGGDVDRVVKAARAELEKIAQRRVELGITMTTLRKEAVAFERRLPKQQDRLSEYSAQIEQLIAPNLRKLRSSYKELADKSGEVREALALYQALQGFEDRRTAIEGMSDGDTSNAEGASTGLPTAATDKFAQVVEKILQTWRFPNAQRVHFDLKSKDLVISGKDRIAYGKGLRAITQSAFSIGLLEYCRAHATSHPGFVVLDSPLLSYKEPDKGGKGSDGGEDDLRGSDLKELFYRYLIHLPKDRQIIIIENTDPPVDVQTMEQVTHFSGAKGVGRPGFFPIE
jgi:DNA repair ATPase RecN